MMACRFVQVLFEGEYYSREGTIRGRVLFRLLFCIQRNMAHMVCLRTDWCNNVHVCVCVCLRYNHWIAQSMECKFDCCFSISPSLLSGLFPTDKDVGMPRHMIASTTPASTSASSVSPRHSKQSHRYTTTSATSHDHHHHHHHQQDADPLTSSFGRGSTDSSVGGVGTRRKLNLSEGGGVMSDGAGVTGGTAPSPVKEQSGLVIQNDYKMITSLNCASLPHYIIIFTLLHLSLHLINLHDSVAWTLINHVF